MQFQDFLETSEPTESQPHEGLRELLSENPMRSRRYNSAALPEVMEPPESPVDTPTEAAVTESETDFKAQSMLLSEILSLRSMALKQGSGGTSLAFSSSANSDRSSTSWVLPLAVLAVVIVALFVYSSPGSIPPGTQNEVKQVIEKALEIANKEKRNSYDYDDLTRTAQKSYEAEWQRLKTGSVKFAGALKMTPSGSDVLIEAKLRLAEAKMFFAIKITHKPSHNIECYADPINMNLSLAMEMPSRTNFNLIGIRLEDTPINTNCTDWSPSAEKKQVFKDLCCQYYERYLTKDFAGLLAGALKSLSRNG